MTFRTPAFGPVDSAFRHIALLSWYLDGASCSEWTIATKVTCFTQLLKEYSFSEGADSRWINEIMMRDERTCYFVDLHLPTR